jgi:hypothetical protein
MGLFTRRLLVRGQPAADILALPPNSELENHPAPSASDSGSPWAALIGKRRDVPPRRRYAPAGRMRSDPPQWAFTEDYGVYSPLLAEFATPGGRRTRASFAPRHASMSSSRKLPSWADKCVIPNCPCSQLITPCCGRMCACVYTRVRVCVCVFCMRACFLWFR